MNKVNEGLHADRPKKHPFGYLRHGNPPCDIKSLPRCQAKAKSTGKRCGNVAVKGKRVCRLHGGLSTGPRTKEGLLRSRKASWKHGLYSAELINLRKFINQVARESRGFIGEISGPSGNGGRIDVVGIKR